MSRYKYAFQDFKKELMARAIGRDMPISTKQAIEICNYLRHRKVAQAKMLLEGVKVLKQAVPFRRFTNGLGHKPGKLAAGRYPVKASTAILKLIESAEANAQTKGLNTGELEIIHICAHQAHKPAHHGRNQGREFKRTHVEIVVQETVAKKEQKEQKKQKSKEQNGEKKKVAEAPKPAAKPSAKPDAKPAAKPADKSAAKQEDKK